MTRTNEQYSDLIRIGAKRFNFIDTPGHMSYIDSAMKGASQVDIGVLMVDAVRYPSGLEGGNTKQLISLLRGNEIKEMIICVNKMDEINWNEEQYTQIVQIFELYFNSQKFINFTRIYLPISAFKGKNLTSRVECPWFKGHYFLEELANLKNENERKLSLPIRMTVKNTFKSVLAKKKGFVLTSKVEGGIMKIQIGEKFMIMPKEIIVSIKGIYREEERIEFAKAGDTVDLVMHFSKEEDFESVEKGNVICCCLNPIPLVQTYSKKIQSDNNDWKS